MSGSTWPAARGLWSGSWTAREPKSGPVRYPNARYVGIPGPPSIRPCVQESMDSLLDPVRAISTVLVIAVGSYAYLLALLGRRAMAPPPADQPRLFFEVLVPCLNEAQVIAGTLESLSALRGRFHISVLDDASDDGSPAIVSGFPAWMVTLVARQGRDARVGKGAALNHGYREVLRARTDALYGSENVIVVVFDADSRVPSDFLERVTPYFSDPGVVGVQSAVRMYNAGRNRLTFWQSLEFIVWARIFSRAKDILGSATLGGNGQCVRLSALMSLGAGPWQPSLTEDLDLSLRLILSRGRIRFCGDTYVAQEAVPSVRQLIRQRARWVQGHLVSWQHLPAILRSRAPLQVRLDLVVFLLLPAGLVPVAVTSIDGWLTFLTSLGTLSLQTLFIWYVLAFVSAPLTAWALVRDGEVDRRRAIGHAHVFLAYSTFWMIAVGRAVWSIIRGDRSWAKTSRNQPSRVQGESTREQQKTLDAGDTSSVRRAGLGHLRGLRSIGSIADIALVASTTLVLIAAAVVWGTYQKVTSAGAQVFPGGVAESTGRPISNPAGAGFVGIGGSPEPNGTTAKATPSPSVVVTPALTGGPSAAPTLTSGPSVDGIIARFPELTACPGENGCYIYVVRPGDNFVSIVNYYQVAYADVLRMNPSRVDPAQLRPGDEIRIPTPRRN